MCNKRKYLIITPRIANMGGAQMYVRNKCKYMQSKGWDVEIITAQKGPIYIADLQEFDYVIPELNFSINLYPKSKQNKIVNDILKNVTQRQYSEIVIESTCISESTWAEVLAQKLGAKHLFFNLQERDIIKSQTIQDFLIFKHYRHELAGIVANSLYNLFLPFNPISLEESYRLLAPCSNVVEDIPCPLLDNINVAKYDYIVGCLSRLDKPFILHAVKDFISYTNKHKNHNYLLLMIGGAPKDSLYEQSILNLFKNIPNADIIITGYIFPIPIKLLNICHAFFASAGSCQVCMRSGVPTISYDANDFRPIGIIGRTTHNSLERGKDEPELDFSILMDDILERKKYRKEPRNERPKDPDFSSHDEFLESMSNEKDYYDFDKLPNSFSERKLYIALKLIGAENYVKLGAWKKKILTKTK